MNRSRGSFQPHVGFKKQSCVTLIPWFDTSCSVCLCYTSSAGSPLEWDKDWGRCCAIALLRFVFIGNALLPDQFQAAEYQFLSSGLTQQRKLFCLLLSSLLTDTGWRSEGLKDHFSSLLPHTVPSAALSKWCKITNSLSLSIFQILDIFQF